MDDGRVLFASASKINGTARQRINKGVGAGGDIVLSHKGTVGKVALVLDDAPEFVCSPQTTFWRTLDEANLNRRYLYAFMRSPAFHAQLATRSGETDMAAYVSLTSQRGLSVIIPPPAEQRAIGHILGTLDDKIDLNRRMSATLEAMVRALFKSWFVDFEPVRAKAEGRDPGLPSHLAALFPNRLVETEQGEIPEGWKTKTIGNVAHFLSGGTPPKSDPRCWNGDIPWISPKSLEGIHVSDAADRVTEISIGHGTRLAPDRSILVMVRGMGLHQGLRIAQARRDLAFNQDVKALVPTEVDSVFLLLGLLVSEFELFTQVKPAGHGTGVLETETLRGIRLHCPTAEQAPHFVTILSGLNERIALNQEETLTLTALRDTLLPKLISGDLRVKDAETFLDRVL